MPIAISDIEAGWVYRTSNDQERLVLGWAKIVGAFTHHAAGTSWILSTTATLGAVRNVSPKNSMKNFGKNPAFLRSFTQIMHQLSSFTKSALNFGRWTLRNQILWRRLDLRYEFIPKNYHI